MDIYETGRKRQRGERERERERERENERKRERENENMFSHRTCSQREKERAVHSS